MPHMTPLDIAMESLTYVAQSRGAAPPRPAPTAGQVDEAEQLLGVRLPPSFVKFMERAGLVLLPDWDLYWVGPPDLQDCRLLPVANEVERDREGCPLPPELIAFCDDGTGNQFCFDTRAAHRPDTPGGELAPGWEYPVVLWDYDEGPDQLDADLEAFTAAAAEDFVAWVKQQVHDSV